MKISSLNLWLRLTFGSAIGAIIYHLSPTKKTEKQRTNIRQKLQKNESERKGEIYTLSANAKR